ncbi:2,3,4,5-tetrahydropyridine-2,6-dicarboxylate N-succinyltransferase [Acidocella sp.]|uniref:2,3,4,5-tetrahydropyridine-2,6-dicarboxylate N-succinyltransferase n=1 Tax=Acidocella sp. TaxID=50710 RepID=UPI00261EB384|nr:2,3,4,5-tetrahydropyridine-2,6-dicarboxylate N-succinyltransferase [Acidocella sp.]
MSKDLKSVIENAWDRRSDISPTTQGAVRNAVENTLEMLDNGQLRVAEPDGDDWVVNQWVKQAVLLSFRIHPNQLVEAAAGGAPAYDKVGLKYDNWKQHRFAAAGVRVVPGAVVRYSSFIAPGVVLMPCFVNVGARIGEGTMIDTWATVGSCAQVGKNCHISGGTGIAGVLEPLQANPVIIEDDCFIGARSEVAEGVIVGRGSVISMGVFIGASTKIVDRETGEIFYGKVPPYSVVVPGTLPGRRTKIGLPSPNLACAVIVKRVDAQTRSKTSVNELLRA